MRGVQTTRRGRSLLLTSQGPLASRQPQRRPSGIRGVLLRAQKFLAQARAGRPVADAALLCLLAWMLGRMIASGQQALGVLVAISIPVAIAIWMSWGVAVVSLVLFIFTLNFLSGWGLVPREVTWLIDLVIVLLAVKALLEPRPGRGMPKSITAALVGLCSVCVASSILNSNGVMTLVAGARHHLKYVLLAYALLRGAHRESTLRSVAVLVLIIGLLQTPVAILQRIYINADDLVSGTIGYNSNQELSLFIIEVACLLLGLLLMDKLRTRGCIIALPVALIPMALNHAKAAFFYLPIAVGAVLLSAKTAMVRFGGKMRLIFVMGIIFIALVVITDNVVKRADMKGFLLDGDAIMTGLVGPGYRYGDLIGFAKDGSLLRGSAAIYAHSIVSRNWATAVLGVGPGNASESFLSGANGMYWDESLDIDKTQLAKSLLEFGYVGLGLLFLLHILLFREVRRVVSDLTDPFWRGIAFGFTGVFAIHITAVVYEAVWTTDVTGFMFWFLGGAILAVGRVRAPARVGEQSCSVLRNT